jgi:protein-S-isoprenylcysteine O-methyltransferase Ste14
VAFTVAVMLVVVFARRLSGHSGLEWLAPLGRLAWPWYVPLGTLLAVCAGIALSYLPHGTAKAEPVAHRP